MSDEIEYRPHSGSNVPGQNRRRQKLTGSYSDLDFLLQELDRLISFVGQFEKDLETELNTFYLPVPESDSQLFEAHNQEWPTKDIGEYSDQIGYRYYKLLGTKETTSAEYIRKRYEEGIRDLTGTSALDILSLVEMTKIEAITIKQFVDKYIGTGNDQSEQRLLETFQDWTIPAQVHAKNLQQAFISEKQRQPVITEKQLFDLTAKDAQQGQALFKVKLNVENAKVQKDVDYLRRNFSDLGPTFYGRFLGPALEYRLGFNDNNIRGQSQSKLKQSFIKNSGTLDGQLRSALADQARRRAMYQNKVHAITQSIGKVRSYRQGIYDLSELGKPMPSYGDRVVLKSSYSAKEIDYFKAKEDEFFDDPSNKDLLEERVVGRLISAHSELTGLENDDHPQYLLRDGGEITGDIQVSEGVRIDGVDISAHRHTGVDGSPQIHGADIILGTVTDGVVNDGIKPNPPTNLQVQDFRERIVPPGVSMIDVDISWEGDSGLTYEHQISLISR